jgi:hypothetical protein
MKIEKMFLVEYYQDNDPDSFDGNQASFEYLVMNQNELIETLTIFQELIKEKGRTIVSIIIEILKGERAWMGNFIQHQSKEQIRVGMSISLIEIIRVGDTIFTKSGYVDGNTGIKKYLEEVKKNEIQG